MSARVAFLTGGSGFVGANLARALLAEGWRVRALARPASDLRNLEGLDVEIVRGDLGEETDLPRALRGSDALFHVAAHYSLARRDAAELQRSNVAGTRRILAAARTAGVGRTVYTSSVAAIGVKSGGIADESYQSPRERLIGAYKRSKFDAEAEAVAASRGGQDVVIVNPSTPIGAWDRKPTPTGDLLLRFFRGRMPALVDTGLNFVDVADVARGHLLACDKGRSGERYILGGENVSMRVLLQRAGAIAGLEAPKVVIPHVIPLVIAHIDEYVVAPLLRRAPSIPIDGVRMSREAMYYDTSKARDRLGFDPRPIDSAIQAAFRWYGEHGYLSRSR